jgi:hypothetical protein
MKLESIKGISLKTLFKTIGITAGVALVASVAQAGIIDTETTTVTETLGSSTPTSYTVTSTVSTTGTAGLDLYSYTVSASAPSVEDFTVQGVIGSSISNITNPAGFTGGIGGAGTVVSWQTANSSTDVSLDSLTFSFDSTDNPFQGTTYANDGGTWQGSPVYVPNVPDSGTTALLIVLGLAGVALGAFALRRKSAMV